MGLDKMTECLVRKTIQVSGQPGQDMGHWLLRAGLYLYVGTLNFAALKACVAHRAQEGADGDLGERPLTDLSPDRSQQWGES